MASYDEGPAGTRDEAQSSELSQPHRRTTSGLGIEVPRRVHQSDYRGEPVDNAAHNADSSSQPYDPHIPSVPAQSGQGHTSNPDYWTPQLTGRTLGGFSPSDGPQGEATPTTGELKGSIYSAWDRGSEKAAYAPLGEGKDLETRVEGDDDAISLDSLQMHDEEHQQHATFATKNFSTVHEVDQEEEEGGYDSFKRQLDGSDKHFHPTVADVHIKRRSWLHIWLLVMAVYSTLLSGLWLGVAIAQPRWGHTISNDGSMSLSTASVLTAIFSKTIEMSFVTVFVAFIGQVLTRRAIGTHEGMTMAEMTMRTWITQPGSLFANGYTLRYTGHTLLGILTLIATLVAMLYTTASDSMIRPKLRFTGWESRNLKAYVRSAYANPAYVENSCATPVSYQMDPLAAGESCLAVKYSGDSYHNLLSFMSAWHDVHSASRDIVYRPSAQASLYDNISMTGSWIEAQYSNASESFQTHQRIINNISLAMPHPGVYKAATNDVNDILQPSDLDGLGAYNISASVVSPAVNVLCVNMNSTELSPIVYTAWPGANTTNNTSPPYQATGWSGWEDDVSEAFRGDEWLNATAVDSIFRWGERYDRRPPVFQLYPADDNILSNSSVQGTGTNQADAIYLLAKSRMTDDYTVCELRSWPAIQCSTQFDNSGMTGMSMSAQCAQSRDYYPEDAGQDPDEDAYVRYMEPGEIAANPDWKNMVDLWRLAINLDGGALNSNASVARLLTELALTSPHLGASLPSMAEALAVLATSTLVSGSLDTPFIHYWDYAWANASADGSLPWPGALAGFHARVRTQEYASWHSSGWQAVFYLVLASAFLINCLCLAYLCRVGLVKDFLEPTNLFALATALPPGNNNDGGNGNRLSAVSSRVSLLRNAAMTGKERRKASRTSLAVPYRLAYKEDADTFYFEEAGDEGEDGSRARATGIGGRRGGGKRVSFHRLSSKIGF
ncbi:hypothetical protein VPNG_08597 [Cytospora leucostoma]|uniref:Uncharacterized protein n=1 Tax=Cytospora leucostoma TaxID=1230097 RepID=A0A423W4C5_9PEZI|nr:hypothetical protein VPNG_08597 [Cytospora leucostoma]